LMGFLFLKIQIGRVFLETFLNLKFKFNVLNKLIDKNKLYEKFNTITNYLYFLSVIFK